MTSPAADARPFPGPADGPSADATPSELFQAQRRAFLREGPPSAGVRRARIDRLIALLAENADALAAAMDADFGGRPEHISMSTDLAGILPDILLTRARLKSWMKPRPVTRGSALLGVRTVVEPTPKGVAGIIGTWNFPVGLAAQPAAAALAAGNRVMIKFSEVTPRTAELFQSLAARYFDPEVLTVVTGGSDVGAAFSRLPFDHLFFTGSPGVGRLVAQAAAANLVPTTLELGGKNPAVIGRGADLAQAAQRIVRARMANGGQICLCPELVFVPRPDVEAFVGEALATGRRILPSLRHDGVVSIVNDRNFDRVVGLIDDARSKGARVRTAGTPDGSPYDRTSRRIALTVVEDVDDGMAIAHEEVFGPVLTVFAYDEVREVTDYLNERPTPLAAYWFGPQEADFDTFRRHVRCGGMTVNDFALHAALPDAPFGGMGQSGSGAYHGRTGFDTFSHLRTVTITRLPVSAGEIMMPSRPRLIGKLLSTALPRLGRRAARRVKAAESR